MPHYFFHTRGSTTFQDLNGLELPDIQSARDEAIHAAGTMLMAGGTLKDDPTSLTDGCSWHMDVTNGSGRILLTLDIVLRHPNTEG